MKLILYLLFFSLFAMPEPAREQKPAISFEIKNAGIVTNGHFPEVSQKISFNPDDLENSYLEGRAKIASINTGISLRDEHLQGRQYFRSDKFPEIVMRSKSLKRTGQNTYTGRFEVIIKDISREIDLPFKTRTKDNRQTFAGEFTLNRLDFGLGEESLVLANEVKVLIYLQSMPVQ